MQLKSIKNVNKILIILIVGGLVFALSARAGLLDGLPGPKIMPDSPFYFLKIWYEKVVTFFSWGAAKKAERYSKIAERRLYEAEQMAKKGKQELTKRLLKEYEKYLNKALGKLKELKKQAKAKLKQGINQRIEEIKIRAQKLVDEVFGE